MSKPTVPAIVGVSSFGTNRGGVSSVTDPAICQQFIDVAVEFGCDRLDTARAYGAGESETILARLDLKGCKVDTKIPARKPGDFAAANLKALVAESVAALNGIPIRVLYWHSMDRGTPFAEQLQAMDELHKEGVYEQFGLCDAYAWEVAEIATMCRERGWVMPTAYQGIYNALDRVVEDELIPCLRKFNIHFAAFSPLAGGLLTGFHLDNPSALESNVRFSSKSRLHPFYGPRYAHTEPILRRVKALAEKHNLTLTEVGVRWLVHHSALRADDDGVCYGGRNPEQIRASLSCHYKGPLPDEVVQALDDAWKNECKGKVGTYAS